MILSASEDVIIYRRNMNIRQHVVLSIICFKEPRFSHIKNIRFHLQKGGNPKTKRDIAVVIRISITLFTADVVYS